MGRQGDCLSGGSQKGNKSESGNEWIETLHSETLFDGGQIEKIITERGRLGKWGELILDRRTIHC